MLTKKQHELLMYINQRLAATGVAPSFDEMKDALHLRSKSGIHRLISGLEERGFIRRLPHRARALEVTKLPEESAAPSTGERGRFSPTVIRGDFSGALPGTPVTGDIEAIDLPLYGRIAAGTPIEALRDPSNTVAVPGTLLGRGEHYALEIAGDSMIEAGILDGDTVIVQRCAGRRSGGHPEAAAPPRCLDCPRAGQPGLRDPDLRPRPGQGAGPPRRSAAALLERHSREPNRPLAVIVTARPWTLIREGPALHVLRWTGAGISTSVCFPAKKLAPPAISVRFADARRLTHVAIVAHGGGFGDETPIREVHPATFRPQSQPCA